MTCGDIQPKYAFGQETMDIGDLSLSVLRSYLPSWDFHCLDVFGWYNYRLEYHNCGMFILLGDFK